MFPSRRRRDARLRAHRGGLTAAAFAVALVVPAVALGTTVPSTGTVIGGVGSTAGAVTDSLTGASRPCAHARTKPSKLTQAAASKALLCSINHARAAHRLGRLAGERHLARAAAGQAGDMVRHHYFAHQRIGGPSLTARLRAAGWHGRAAGEALAWGCGSLATPAATVRAWLHSPPHRAILLSRTYRRAGIGVAPRAPVSCGPGGTWVLDAGA